MCPHGAVTRRGRKIGRKMTACGKSDYRDLTGVAMPVVRMRAYALHCFRGFQQSRGEDGWRDGIAQHKRVASGREELHGDRFGLAVGGHGIAAARNHQNAGALTFGIDLLAVVENVPDERGLTAIDAGDDVFTILHIATLDGLCVRIHAAFYAAHGFALF